MLILVKHGISGGDCPSSLQDAGAGYHKCAKKLLFLFGDNSLFLFSFGGKIGIICIVCFWFVKVILHIEIVVN